MRTGVYTIPPRGSRMALCSTSGTSSLRPCRKCCKKNQGATISTNGTSRRSVTTGRTVTTFANPPSSTIVRIELETAVAKKCLLIEALLFEKRQRITITGVRQQSPAWEAGVRPGDELVGISDPNLDTVWEFDEMTSVRFVKDALRMRIPDTVTLLIDRRPPSPGNTAGVLMEHLTSQGTAKPSDEEEPKFLDAVLSSVELDDSDSETLPSDNVTSELERQYRQMQTEKTRSTERIQARKAALSTVSERNDAPFFLTIVAVFLGPPFLILIWAFSSGYLDRLSSMY